MEVSLSPLSSADKNLPALDKDKSNMYEPLIRPLLAALEWKGEEHHIREALPFGMDALDLQGFQDTMAHLGFPSIVRGVSPRQLDSHWLPAVCLDKEGFPYLLISTDDCQKFADEPHAVVLFHPADMSASADGQPLPLRHLLKRFYPILRQVLFFSLVIGVIALAPILFNRLIYDHVIASGSGRSLPMLLIGVSLALCAEIVMRHMRNKQLSFFGGRIDHYVSSSVFERLLFLPSIYTERAAVSAQIARLKDFESVREFFTGPLATLFFEMPLVFVYIIIMAAFSGWLALIPLALVGAYALLLGVMRYKIKERSKESSQSGSRKQDFLLETVTKLRAIRLAGLDAVWQQRYRQISHQASWDSFQFAFTLQVLETFSYALMTLGALATLGFGVWGVFAQTLSLGGLIASMMLVWRIIGPLQVCCASFNRLQQLNASTRQIQRLLSLPPEHDPHLAATVRPRIAGHLTFYRVSLRYTPDAEAALLGVSFDVKPGQIVAIKGNNGSGKSSLLKLALGLYQPQGGSVRLDGLDSRQFDPLAIRQAISYVPQIVDFFAGSIRDNLLLANPAATEENCWKALEESCAIEAVKNLRQGMDTPVGENAENLSYLLKQRLNLARAYIKPAPIMLFDEASHALGKEDDEAFVKKINSLRGHTTVLLVTHREDHMRLADQLLVLDKGELTHAGPPAQVLAVLQGRKT